MKCISLFVDGSTDVIQHVRDKHIAVISNGHFYIFQATGLGGQKLSCRDIEKQLTWIIDDSKMEEASEIESA
jgi:hypothetical protein